MIENPQEKLDHIEFYFSYLWQFEHNGLNIHISQSKELANEYALPPTAQLGLMDFMPNENEQYEMDPQTSLTTISRLGLEGLQAFFQKIDKGESEPDYLIGKTDRNLALATRRLGFNLRDITRDVHDKNKKTYHVIGKPKVVRQKLDELLQKKNKEGIVLLDILQQRDQSRRI